MKSTFLLILWLYCWHCTLADVGAEELPAAEQPAIATSPAPVEEDFDPLDDPFAEELDEVEEVSLAGSDPLEPLNRGIFWFNDKLYFYLLKPVARGFRMVPEPVRVSVANFFSNITTPVRFINATAQMKFGDAGRELGRFAINTTVGVLGFFDPAKSRWGLRKKEEDFGQTLGRYGLGAGAYIVLPVFGPSNVRDGIGLVVDFFLDPFYYLVTPVERLAARTTDVVNDTSLDKDTYEGIKRDALDPYLFIRDAYAQHRKGKIDK